MNGVRNTVQQGVPLHSIKFLVDRKKVGGTSINVMQRALLNSFKYFAMQFFNWKERNEERARVGELAIYEDYIQVGQDCTNHEGLVAMVTFFVRVCGSSIWSLLHITILSPSILM